MKIVMCYGFVNCYPLLLIRHTTPTPYGAADNYFIWTALCLLGLSLLLIALLYLRRSAITLQDKQIAHLRFRYQYLIYDALVESQTNGGGSAQDIIVDKLKKEIANTNLHKQVLIDLIIDLKKNFTGDSERQFTQLYHALGLPKYSLNKLDHSRWDIQAKGIKELTEINYHSFRTQRAIISLSTAQSDLVSQEAQVASLRFRKDPLQFMQGLKVPLTVWQQINLHHILLKSAKRHTLNFTKWLSSPNTSVVVFSLRMIADFDHKHATPSVVSLLLHKLPEVREEAIKTLLKMEARTHLPQISAAGHSCSSAVALQVLEAVERWGEYDHPLFLEPYQSHSASEVRNKAATLLAGCVTKQPTSSLIHRNV